MYYEAATLAPYIKNGEKVPNKTWLLLKAIQYGMVIYLAAITIYGICMTSMKMCDSPSPECYAYVFKVNASLQTICSLCALAFMLLALWKISKYVRWLKAELKTGLMSLHILVFTVINLGRLVLLFEMWNYEMNWYLRVGEMTTYVIMQFILLYVLWGIGASQTRVRSS